MRIKCLAQEHNTMPRPGLEPGPVEPESSALTTRPSRLPLILVPVSLVLLIKNVSYSKFVVEMFPYLDLAILHKII